MAHSRRSWIEQCEREVNLLSNLSDDEKSDGWEDALLEAKKSLEQSLFDYVINGCSDTSFIRGAFPELSACYDEESYELLDEKIRVLREIASSGPDCDYLSIDGFDDILEGKAPGVETMAFD